MQTNIILSNFFQAKCQTHFAVYKSEGWQALLTVVGKCFKQTVQAALNAVSGAICRRKLQLLQCFTKVIWKQRYFVSALFQRIDDVKQVV